MGLQSQLEDLASDSLPLFFLSLIFKFISYLRSLFTFSNSPNDTVQPDSTTTQTQTQAQAQTTAALCSSGLAGLVLLTEQLNLNRKLSYRFKSTKTGGEGGKGHEDNKGVCCVVCLCCLEDGDHVRELRCSHVFHKECLDGWIDRMNFNCPLCRLPLVSGERAADTRRRVGGDFLGWFASF